MGKDNKIQLFENQPIRTAWNEELEEWYFSIIDVVAVLTESKDANAYWRKLKQRLIKEGNETETNCHALKNRTVITNNSIYYIKESRTFQTMISTAEVPDYAY